MSLCQLPLELLHLILFELPDSTLRSIMVVNKFFLNIWNGELFWKHKCHREFHHAPRISEIAKVINLSILDNPYIVRRLTNHAKDIIGCIPGGSRHADNRLISKL